MSKNVEEELSIFCMEIEHNFLPYMSYFPFQHFCNDGKLLYFTNISTIM